MDVTIRDDRVVRVLEKNQRFLQLGGHDTPQENIVG